jgi:hypothetical protein
LLAQPISAASASAFELGGHGGDARAAAPSFAAAVGLPCRGPGPWPRRHRSGGGPSTRDFCRRRNGRSKHQPRPARRRTRKRSQPKRLRSPVRRARQVPSADSAQVIGARGYAPTFQGGSASDSGAVPTIQPTTFVPPPQLGRDGTQTVLLSNNKAQSWHGDGADALIDVLMPLRSGFGDDWLF